MTALEAYVRLERLRIDLDVAGLHARAEDCDSVLDRWWYALSEADREHLRSRGRIQVPKHPGEPLTAEQPAPEGGTRLVLL